MKCLLDEIAAYAEKKLKNVDAGHDCAHIQRVYHNAIKINELEKADDFLIKAGVLLHDVTDDKLFNKQQAENELVDFLKSIGLDFDVIHNLIQIINAVSFGNDYNGVKELTREQMVVRDADRLDAMGAIGIARAFHYGGTKNRALFDPDIAPQTYSSKEEYRNSNSPTLNHFYEKLLLLKDKMHTETGRIMAKKRHDFMVLYLKHFFEEADFKGFNIG